MTAAAAAVYPGVHNLSAQCSNAISRQGATTDAREICIDNKKLSYREGMERRAMSVEILSTAAQLYEKLHLKRLAVGERSLKVIGMPLFDSHISLFVSGLLTTVCTVSEILSLSRHCL